MALNLTLTDPHGAKPDHNEANLLRKYGIEKS